MNIGIIVFSQTGNTLTAAKKLKDGLSAKGHSAAVEQVTTEGEISPEKPVVLRSAPDAAQYDSVVFAAPVMAFALNPAMKAYLAQIKELAGKKAGFLVTQQLPFGWMGGNRAVSTMSELVQAKGGSAGASGIVHWGNEAKRNKQMAEAVETLCGMF
jgi:NAD(P)H dehydrogenase (quinone)